MKEAREIEIYITGPGGWMLGEHGFPDVAKIDPDFIYAANGTWYAGIATPVEPNNQTVRLKLGQHQAIYQLCGFTATGAMLMRMCATKIGSVMMLRTNDQELRKKCEVWLNERENQDAKG